MALSGGDWSILYGSPLAIALWVMVVASLLLPLILNRRKPLVRTTLPDDLPPA